MQFLVLFVFFEISVSDKWIASVVSEVEGAFFFEKGDLCNDRDNFKCHSRSYKN